ncbi:putative lysophospholipase [Corynebacterium kutscheri]|uniref:Lysophospholipase n=1 Tax=Corynebacterium kutscheri TaxID=35755 RepID=A0A0F6TDA5_9CORY|nr:alpha/beta hydrolase [Corynebacterium kutscheri]AKE41456.1 lysophospholipase [Corynebacterium kutscheri]VEH09780.1 putative lysophospholipase [Corynebacterium kutscheri]VEH79863.1 putative lysophospholipase [Corynebacterium kutscheri]
MNNDYLINPDVITWEQDILGEDFFNHTINLGIDPDGETDIVATLIRYQPQQPAKNQVAILYLHGMTDYFFHRHIAEHLYHYGIDTFAVDTRKCGRSLRAGQSAHYATDMELYFSELTTSLEIILADHHSVIPLAHSTGGLIASLWLDHLRRTRPDLHAHIAACVLNSPWLDMMAPPAVTKTLSQITRISHAHRPHVVFPGGKLSTYGESIHISEKGEWDFDLSLKPITGHVKYLGWLHAVLLGQRRIHADQIKTGVPTLVLCSTASQLNKAFNPASQRSDTVLDVRQIRMWAPFLAREVTTVQLENALHDVFLSQSAVREKALNVTTTFIQHILATKNSVEKN